MLTPTDLEGWVRFGPVALVLFLALIGLMGLLENTELGRRILDRVIDRIVR